jgi:hypothetical protein
MMRNAITVLGVMGICSVFFFFIRPDWIRHIASNPDVQGTVTTKVKARMSVERLMTKDLPKDKGGLLCMEQGVGGPDYTSLIIDELGEDLPSRNMPFILVINKSSNSMRYCRLSNNVRKICLRVDYPGVKFQEITNTPGGPYQVMVWVPSALDLQMEFELLMNSPSRS